jgi:predicted DNA-binding transcriptional regulator AlpA
MESPFGPRLYVTQAAIAEVVGLSRKTLWRLTSAGQFTGPVELKPGLWRYYVPDVLACLVEWNGRLVVKREKK